VAATLRAHASSALRAYGQNWSREAAERISSLPPGLRRYLLYSQRGQSWRQLARVLELWWGLDLEREADLRLCVALALSRSAGRAGIEWCATVLQVAPARRVQFMELSLETGAYQRQPAPETTAQVLQADQLCSDKVWRRRMYAIFQAVTAKHDLAYLLDGFQLANECNYEPFRFRTKGPRGTSVAIRRWAAHVARAKLTACAQYWPAHMWQDCAEFEGLVEVLRTLPPDQLDPETAYAFLPTFLRVLDDEEEAARMAKWQWLRSHIRNFFEPLTAAHLNYRRKWLQLQREFLLPARRWNCLTVCRRSSVARSDCASSHFGGAGTPHVL